jgi:hypothetical protein
LRDLGTEADVEVGLIDPHPVQNARKLACSRDAAHNMLDRLAIRRLQARKADRFLTRSNKLAAASQSA